jgi:hypothetical protein
MRWLADDANISFRDQYTLSRQLQADHFADEILEIADDSTGDVVKDKYDRGRTDHEAINRSRLRIDTRKWLMSKVAPRKYGDRLTMEQVGAVHITISKDDAALG